MFFFQQERSGEETVQYFDEKGTYLSSIRLQKHTRRTEALRKYRVDWMDDEKKLQTTYTALLNGSKRGKKNKELKGTTLFGIALFLHPLLRSPSQCLCLLCRFLAWKKYMLPRQPPTTSYPTLTTE